MITQVVNNSYSGIKLEEGASPLPQSLSPPSSSYPQENVIVDIAQKNFNGEDKLNNSSPSVSGGKAQQRQREIEKTIEKINEKFNYLNIELRFKRDDELKKTLIQLFDKKTKKVVRQIPPEDLVKMIKKLKEIEEKMNSKLSGNEELKGLILNLRV